MKDYKALGLRRELFWDIREEDINKALADHDAWVIPRIFEYGDLHEILSIIDFYGEDRSRIVLRAAVLKPMARAMAYLLLDVEAQKNEERPLFYK